MARQEHDWRVLIVVLCIDPAYQAWTEKLLSHISTVYPHYVIQRCHYPVGVEAF